MPRRSIRSNISSITGDYPLDDFSNIIMGVSFRRISSTYLGACMRASNSVSVAFQDINFIDDYVDTATMLSLAGVNDLLVSDYYNQSNGTGIMKRTILGQMPSGVVAGVIPEFAGFQGLFMDNSQRFEDTSGGYECNYPCAYYVFSHLPSDVQGDGRGLVDLEYNSGNSSFLVKASEGNSYSLNYVRPPADDTVEVVTAEPSIEKGIILEAYTSPTEIGIVVNGVADTLSGSFSSCNGLVNNDYSFNGQRFGGRTMLEVIITDGRQVGLADRLNQHYGFY